MKKIFFLTIILLLSINSFALISIESSKKEYSSIINSMLFNYYNQLGINHKKLEGTCEFFINEDKDNFTIFFKLKLRENNYLLNNGDKCHSIILDGIKISQKEIDQSIKRSGMMLFSKENEAMLRFVNNFIGQMYEIKRSRLIEKDYHPDEQSWESIYGKKK